MTSFIINSLKWKNCQKYITYCVLFSKSFKLWNIVVSRPIAKDIRSCTKLEKDFQGARWKTKSTSKYIYRVILGSGTNFEEWYSLLKYIHFLNRNGRKRRVEARGENHIWKEKHNGNENVVYEHTPKSFILLHLVLSKEMTFYLGTWVGFGPPCIYIRVYI